jgi:hypothetical protein
MKKQEREAVKRSSQVNWASFAIEKLREGQPAKVRPHGYSMTGNLNAMKSYSIFTEENTLMLQNAHQP